MKGRERFWKMKKVIKQRHGSEGRTLLFHQFLPWNDNFWKKQTAKQVEELKRLLKSHSWLLKKGFNSSTCLSALKGNFQQI